MFPSGEDRWLCTLLLKQGWRVEYNSASDAYTNAPEEFKELYNQRHRWGPSTMANVADLLGVTTVICKRNSSMSKFFMFYQLFNLISAIVAPATICLLIAGSLTFTLNMNAGFALVLAVVPPAIYLGLCFKLKPDTQITIAAILSIMYAFFMLVVCMSILGSKVKEQTILTPSSIFVVAMAVIYIFTAIMHPQEAMLVFFGFLYIICIPSAYLLLTIYSMVNMNNVSWGTRETKPDPKTVQAVDTTPQTATQKDYKTCQRFFSWVKCCKKYEHKSSREQLNQQNLSPEPEPIEPGPQNTIVEDINVTEEQRQEPDEVYSPLCWVTDLQSRSKEMQLQEDFLEQEEEVFWTELLEKYLQPLENNKDKQKKMSDELKNLRNKINFAFFFLNALWLVATFTLQIFDATFSIRIPKVNLELENTGDITIDPIGFMFIIGFATSVVVQCVAMVFHRISTLIHYVAFLDTEPSEKKPEKDMYLQGKKIITSKIASRIIKHQ